jgi:hypothetical protein
MKTVFFRSHSSANCYKTMRTLLKQLALLMLLACTALTAQAQATPEAVAQAYIEASRNNDWQKAFSYLHPDALIEFKKTFEPMFAGERSAKGAEFLFGVKSRAEFDQLTGGQLMEKLVSKIGSSLPGFLQLLGKMEMQIIGPVQETPDVVHLVCRLKMPLDALPIKDTATLRSSIRYSKMEVISLQRYENTWRVLLSAELEGLAQMYSKIFALNEEKQAVPPPRSNKPAPRKSPGRKRK